MVLSGMLPRYRADASWLLLSALVALSGILIVCGVVGTQVDFEVLRDGSELSFTAYERQLKVETEERSVFVAEVYLPCPTMGGRLSGLSLYVDDRMIARDSADHGCSPYSYDADSRYLGDWYIDTEVTNGPSKEPLWRYELHRATKNGIPSLSTPARVRLKGTLRGRSVAGVTVLLRGTSDFQLIMRHGLLNSDMSILRGDETIASGELVVPISATLAALGEIPAWLVFVAGLLLLVLRAVDATFLGAAGRVSGSVPCQSKGHSPDHISARRTPELSTDGGEQRSLVGVPILVLGIGSFLAVLLLNSARSVFERVPHFQDDLGYLIRAKWLTIGAVSESIDPSIVQFFDLPFFYLKEGAIRSVYPIGWPLLLAIGQYVGQAWIVPCVCMVCAFVAFYRLSLRYRSTFVTLFSSFMFASSPMYQVLGSTMMAHAASTLMMIVFIAGLARVTAVGPNTTGWVFSAIGGFCGGYLVAIRPLTGVVALVIASFYCLGCIVVDRRTRTLKSWLSQGIALGAGGILGIIPAAVDNWLVTGSPMTFAYTDGQGMTWSLEDLAGGLQRADLTAALIPTHAFGWGYGYVAPYVLSVAPLAFCLVPFFTRRFCRLDVLGALLIVGLLVSYVGHAYIGVHAYGPRFYSESFFAIYLLSARGLTVLNDVALTLYSRCVVTILRAASFAMIGAAMITSVSRMERYRGYNDIRPYVARAIAETRPATGTVLVRDWYQLAGAVDFFGPKLSTQKLVVAISHDPKSDSVAVRTMRGPYYVYDHEFITLRPISKFMQTAAEPTLTEPPEMPPATKE